MTSRIAIHLGVDMIRVASADASGIVAVAERPMDPALPVGQQLDDALQVLPSAPGRPSIVVALDPPMAWSKRITDLPSLSSARLREQAVRENADRYFIGEQSRLVVVSEGPAGLRATAFDQDVIGNLRHTTFASSARDVVVLSSDHVEAKAPDGIGREYAIAVGALSLSLTTIPRLSLSSSSERAARRRSRYALSGAIVASFMLLFAPVLQSRRVLISARAQLQPIADSARKSMDALRDIDDARRRLAVVESSRWPFTATSLLAELAKQLPADASVLAFTFDSARGSAVLIAPSILQVLPALDSMPMVGLVRLSGPVTRERIGAMEVDRATVLLTWRSFP